MISIRPVEQHTLKPWRARYRDTMPCQIVQDSLHRRAGWVESFAFSVENKVVGYGSVLVGGPWLDEHTLYECFVEPAYERFAFDLCETLLATSGACAMRSQTNDRLMTLMLHTFSKEVTCEKILFEDHQKTNFVKPEIQLKSVTEVDPDELGVVDWSMGGDWVLVRKDEVVARGGIATHYNRPYVDLYMEVAEPYRRQGLGVLLVQHLKRICYTGADIPAARCNPSNIASRNTLMKAGLRPSGLLLTGKI